MTYVNPMLVANISERGTPFTRDLYAEAHAKGYLVRQGSEVWLGYSSAALVDLTNPDARAWLKAVIKTQMLQSGVSGWMSDFGEACPLDATLFSGVSGARYHSQYPADWAQLNREVRFPKCACFMHYRYGPGPAAWRVLGVLFASCAGHRRVRDGDEQSRSGTRGLPACPHARFTPPRA